MDEDREPRVAAADVVAARSRGDARDLDLVLALQDGRAGRAVRDRDDLGARERSIWRSETATPRAASCSRARAPYASSPPRVTSATSAPSIARCQATFAGAPPSRSPSGKRSHRTSPHTMIRAALILTSLQL